ncbi:MAG: universal stress protein [Euryarchaeota archaeon]|nr:universal stress protein [Euryarchaeota archaeon]
MYKSILIPTDGSEIAEEAVRHGVRLAKALNAKVYGLYVIDISAFAGIPTEAVWESMRVLLEEEGKRALASVEELAKELGVECETIIREGIPAEDIVSVAREKGADLIVMGTAGRTGLDRFLLGSVAEKVVRTSSCPVMVVHK